MGLEVRLVEGQISYQMLMSPWACRAPRSLKFRKVDQYLEQSTLLQPTVRGEYPGEHHLILDSNSSEGRTPR
jgi:hypothetical protein